MYVQSLIQVYIFIGGAGMKFGNQYCGMKHNHTVGLGNVEN